MLEFSLTVIQLITSWIILIKLMTNLTEHISGWFCMTQLKSKRYNHLNTLIYSSPISTSKLNKQLLCISLKRYPTFKNISLKKTPRWITLTKYLMYCLKRCKKLNHLLLEIWFLIEQSSLQEVTRKSYWLNL